MSKETFDLYSSVYKGFITASVIVFIIGITTSGATTLNCYQCGYVVYALAIMLILIRILNNYETTNMLSTISGTFLTILPFILILIVIGFLLYFNIIYRTIIVNGDVENGYYTFSNVAIVLLLIQLCIISMSISTDSFNEKGFTRVTSSSVLLLAVLTAISANIIRTILKYYTTDGFITNNSILIV
jgi:hypothetical protein